MKHGNAIRVLIPLVLVAGCGQTTQVKVTYESNPPGGILYKQDGEVLGSCPKVLWYDLNEEAIRDGYLLAQGLTVRWSDGAERRSDDLIKITVNGTDRRVIFSQPGTRMYAERLRYRRH